MMLRMTLAGILLSCAVALGGYIEERKDAMELVNAGKHQEAADAFVAMSEGDYTQFQKSDALEQAVLSLIRLKEYDRAEELAEQTPLEPFAKLSRMRILDAQRKWGELVEQFGDEKIKEWPPIIRGDAYSVRGNAAYRAGKGELAVSDLQEALKFKIRAIEKGSTLLSIGDAYANLLGDEEKALEAYRKVHEAGHPYRSARAAMNAASLLIKTDRAGEAVAELDKVDTAKIGSGLWVALVLTARGDALAAAGRKDEAIAEYKRALDAENIPGNIRERCEEAIEKLEAE